jgi:hypothetical protein
MFYSVMSRLGFGCLGIALIVAGVYLIYTRAIDLGLATRLEPWERSLETASPLLYEFHRVVDDPHGLGLRFPGFILGFEKAPRDVVRGPALVDDRLKDGERTIVDLHRLEQKQGGIGRWWMRDRLNDGKVIFLSHALEYRLDPRTSAIDHEPFYSAYGQKRKDALAATTPLGTGSTATDAEQVLKQRQLYSTGLNVLETLDTRLERALKEGAYTHLILYCFGWNSGQSEAIRNANSLHSQLLHAQRSQAPSMPFRPLAILVTWPSHWSSALLKPLDYQNKANDADELGIVMLNTLIHRTLLPAAEAAHVPTLAFGHSFGARALSRGLFSSSVLGEPGPTRKWDLFVGLQAAFSINRFLPAGAAWEGAPYLGYAKYVRKVVLTHSPHDKAVTLARWSPMSGGSGGHERAEEFDAQLPEQSKRFDFAQIQDQGSISALPPGDNGRILYLDAQRIVRFPNYLKGGKAHSDIYTTEMGRVLWSLVERYGAPSRAGEMH